MLAKDALAKRLALEVEERETKPFSLSCSRMNREQDCPPNSRTTTFLTVLRQHFDYRFLLIGSLLPDLLDKPIGDIFFYQPFRNGRIFGHTLCFTACLAVLGAYVYKRWKKLWFLILSFGSAIHLILDQMWLNPRTLLWPIYGWSFASVDSTNFFGWLPEMFHALATDASVYVPEIIGFSIVAWFVAKVIQTENLYTFVRSGLVSVQWSND